jgi:hypothetical protein
MGKNGKMQKVIMGILATMLVASLVLAVASQVQVAFAIHCWYGTWTHCSWTTECPPYPGRVTDVYIRQCCHVPGYGTFCTPWSYSHSDCGC